MIDLRIDGDAIVYRAGFAADSKSAELSHSLYNAKAIIKMIQGKFSPNITTIWLTNTDNRTNFRFLLTDNYKGNRSKKCKLCVASGREFSFEPSVVVQNDKGMAQRLYRCTVCDSEIPDTKPVFYHEIRQFLIKHYGAKVSEWGEADDNLSVDCGSDTVIASSDKDLLMVPAMHYRINSGKLIKSYDPGMLSYVKDKGKLIGVGKKWFFAQMLLGDTIDNIIKPKKGLGDLGVYKLLKDSNNVFELYDIVYKVYKESDVLDRFDLNCKLLWMARKTRQVFDYDECLVEYK